MRHSLESLATFAQVAAEGTFSAAARKLGKSQSTVSETIANLEVDLNTRMVRSAGENVPLTDTEYSILEFQVKNRGRTVTTQELYESVWNEKFLPGSGNTIMVHVLNLRRKIEEVPSSPRIIRTVWGRGYQVD